MNQCFTSITKQQNLKIFPQLTNLENILNFCHNHISIEKIRSSNNTQSESFTFHLVSTNETKRETLILRNSKASKKGDISVNDIHMEELVLYWIQYKNSLKYKVVCFWRFSYVYPSSFNSIIVLMSEKRDSSNRQ